MKCPACAQENIEGIDNCENCGSDLRSIDTLVSNKQMSRVLMRDKIHQLETRATAFLKPETPVSVAIQEMNSLKMGCILVGPPQEKPFGLLTERELLFHPQPLQNFLSLPVEKLMLKNPECLTESHNLAAAVHLMSLKEVRYIPILRKQQDTMVLTSRQILNYLALQLNTSTT